MSDTIVRIAKFLVTGAIGITVNLGSYHLLVASLGVPYLPGSMLALACSTIVGFLLQKYWTFADRSSERAPKQLALYVLIAGFNMLINTAIVYVMVEYAGAHYLLAQATGAAVVAVSSYLLYRSYVFASFPNQH